MSYAGDMVITGGRLRKPTRLVLGALARSGPDHPAWGYRLCEETGLGPEAVYPCLERLEAAGHVHGYQEAHPPLGRPSRRFYELTSTGHELFVKAQAAPVRWSPVSGRRFRPAPRAGAAGPLRGR